jgi:hypothetical protein
MNLFENSDAELEAAFDAVEGIGYWSRCIKYPDRFCLKEVKQALLAQMACSPNWDGCFVIYGAVGLHRYFVWADGEIKYSVAHGRRDAVKASASGFELFN